ncbi:MAG: hypothetical protein C4555_01530 [Dehalococcoidia bacterium]|jgi:hypothetical protein|nr:MAG: hypothetical protein C4555_01530 [Dehalococcoidia bacterium]
MPGNLAMAIVGGVFVVAGIIGILWGRREARQDFNILASHADVRTDARKLVQNSWRINSGAGALVAGGIIAIIVGVVLLGLLVYLIYRG